MRSIRFGSSVYAIGPLACLRCRRPSPDAAYGITRHVCSGSRCRAVWEAVRLPPGTTGAQLLELYGSDVARAIHGALCPESDGCSTDALAAWVLPIPSTVPTYLQRLPDTPEPLIGWHRADHMLRSLMGSR